jgi:membrane-bound lytic murein transglycosylase D
MHTPHPGLIAAPSRAPWTSALAGILLAMAFAVLPGCASLNGPAGAGLENIANATVVTTPGPDATPEASRTGVGAAAATATSPSVPAPPTPPAVATTGRVGLDSLNPDQPIRFDEPDAKRDLWQRIRGGYAIPDLQNDQLVLSTEQWYATRPDYVQRMTSRGARYLFHIVEEVQKRKLPTELALLPFIESAFNPQALSTAKASGMWQFMPATGRDFSLKQNVFRDDRRDVLASTRAALDYLTRLHAQFGHWHLALAAYNWGEGNVQRAIQRNQRAGLPTDYESLRMPDETRRYVPKLLAVKNIVTRPEAYGLSLPPLENHPYFLTVPIERDIDVAMAARLAGMDEDEFAALNPQHNKPVILAAGTPHILLPYSNAERYLAELERHKGALASWTAWVAPKTLRTSEAAKLTGMEESRLREVNRIPRGMMIRQGSALLIPRHGRHQQDVSEQVADNGSISLQREAAAKAKSKPGAPAKTAAAKAKPGSSSTKVASTKSKPTPKAAVSNPPSKDSRPRVAAAPSDSTVRR